MQSPSASPPLYVVMLNEAERYALSKTSKSAYATLGLAMMAGVFIGLAFMFYITVTTGNDALGWGINRLTGGLAFSMGLMLIILCNGELFTSSVLSAISLAKRQINGRHLLRTWGVVYVGNFIGAMLLLTLTMGAELYQLDGGKWGLNALHIAQHKLQHSPIQAFSLGILCNMLVCLAIWMTFSAKQAGAKAALVALPVAMFVSSGFEHCVANMFMVPLGIAISQFAPVEFWQQVGVPASQFTDLTLTHFINHNLILVTLGNILGGAVFIGLTQWHFLKAANQKPVAQRDQVKPTQLPTNQTRNTIMNANRKVNTLMQTQFTSLSPTMPVVAAIDTLMQNGVEGAPVVANNGQLLGFFSYHDVGVYMWCNDYQAAKELKVEQLMHCEPVAISPTTPVADVAEYLFINKDELYPVNSTGFATNYSAVNLEQRARKMVVARPKVLPVIEDGKLVGIVQRKDVMNMMRPLLGEYLEPVNNKAAIAAEVA